MGDPGSSAQVQGSTPQAWPGRDWLPCCVCGGLATELGTRPAPFSSSFSCRNVATYDTAARRNSRPALMRAMSQPSSSSGPFNTGGIQLPAVLLCCCAALLLCCCACCLL